MSTCNRLTLGTLGYRPIMPKNLPWTLTPYDLVSPCRYYNAILRSVPTKAFNTKGRHTHFR